MSHVSISLPFRNITTGKDRHLRGRAQFRVFGAEGGEAHGVAVAGGDAFGPRGALGAGPLEAVVGVAELTGGQRREADLPGEKLFESVIARAIRSYTQAF